MKLSIVILNWNAADDTIACVRPITAWKSLQPTIWVVDNASTDDSVALILRACPNIELVQNSTNLGFAEGTNRGIIHALAAENSPILLLNNDAMIGENDVIRLLETLYENEAIGFVGPLLFDAEQKERLISAGGKNPVLYHQTRVRHFDTNQPLQQVETISGTAVLVRPELFDKIGLLDPEYFFSTELADLCTRGKQAGYLRVIDSRARAYHTLSRSSHFRDTLYTYYIIRNRFLYVRKFYRDLAKGLLYGLWAGYGLVLTLKLQLSGKPASARAVFVGVKDGWQGRFGGQNERVLAICRRPIRMLDWLRSEQLL